MEKLQHLLNIKHVYFYFNIYKKIVTPFQKRKRGICVCVKTTIWHPYTGVIKTLRNGWLEVPFCTHVTKCISLLLTGFYKNKRGIYIAVKNHKAINNCNLKIGCIFLQHLTFHTLVTGFRISIAPNSFVNVCNSAIKWCNSIISFINFIIFLFVTSCFLCRRTIVLSLKRIFWFSISLLSPPAPFLLLFLHLSAPVPL